MFLPGRLSRPLAILTPAAEARWLEALGRHPFWRGAGLTVDAEHRDLGFHILLHEGRLADPPPPHSGHAFDALPVPPAVLADPELRAILADWSVRHTDWYGPGVVQKLGWYVIGPGGVLGYHIDGPVFLRGARADLADPALQRGLVDAHAAHRTILPLAFNPADRFLICDWNLPLARRQLFEFSNMLPHAYFNHGREPAVLLVTTYLEAARLPAELFGPHRALSAELASPNQSSSMNG